MNIFGLHCNGGGNDGKRWQRKMDGEIERDRRRETQSEILRETGRQRETERERAGEWEKERTQRKIKQLWSKLH